MTDCRITLTATSPAPSQAVAWAKLWARLLSPVATANPTPVGDAEVGPADPREPDAPTDHGREGINDPTT